MRDLNSRAVAHYISHSISDIFSASSSTWERSAYEVTNDRGECLAVYRKSTPQHKENTAALINGSFAQWAAAVDPHRAAPSNHNRNAYPVPLRQQPCVGSLQGSKVPLQISLQMAGALFPLKDVVASVNSTPRGHGSAGDCVCRQEHSGRWQ